MLKEQTKEYQDYMQTKLEKSPLKVFMNCYAINQNKINQNNPTHLPTLDLETYQAKIA